MSANYKLVRMPGLEENEEIQPYHVRFVPNRTVSIKDLRKELVSKSSFSMADIIGLMLKSWGCGLLHLSLPLFAGIFSQPMLPLLFLRQRRPLPRAPYWRCFVIR